MNNINPILFHYNLDENGNPKSIIINGEQNQASVLHYSVQLKQTPDEEYNIVVMDSSNNTLSQVDEMEDITEDTYYVDYKNALVYFHTSKAGKTFIFNYAGVGYELISCSRVYDENDVNGQEVVRTLQDIINKGRECIEALNTIGNAIEVLRRLENYIVEGTELANNLDAKIATGNQLSIDLTSKITTGTTLKNDLTTKITQGTTLNTDLGTKITTGTTLKNDLAAKITEGNTLKNDLAAKITEGNTTKTNLDTSITNANESLNAINISSNGTWTIPLSSWVGTAPNLTYVINHKMNSKNLIVSVVDTTTQKSIFPDYRIVDVNNIEMQSMESCNITVTINARYYTGKDASSVQQEIIDARKGEIDLKAKMDKIEEAISVKALNVDGNRNTVAKDVTGAINELNTKTNTLNTNISNINSSITDIYSKIPSKRAKVYMISGRALAGINDCDDIIIITHNDGTVTAIDFGKNGYYTQIKAKLDEIGITKIDRAIATHSHGDHIGNATEIIRDFGIKKLYLREKVLPQLPDYENQPPYDTPTMHTNMLNGCTTYGVEVIEIGHNGKITINNNESFTTYCVDSTPVTDYNLRSLMVLYENKYKRILFEGDLTLGNDDTVIAPNLKYADIIKIGHHGLNAPSPYPSSWLKTMPSIAVLNDTYSTVQSQNNTKLKGYNVKTTTVKKNEGCCMFIIEDGVIYESNRLETVF